MQTTIRPPPLAASPIGQSQKKGRCVTGGTRKGQVDQSPSSLFAWMSGGQEPRDDHQSELPTLPLADFRSRREELEAAAVQAADDANAFLEWLVEALALELAVGGPPFTDQQILRAAFGSSRADKKSSDLVAAVIRGLEGRELIERSGLRWRCANRPECIRHFRNLYDLLSSWDDDSAEGGTDE